MKKTITYYILAAIALCVTIATLFSCNPQKQLAKAENKVLANPSSVNKIGKVWEQNNPCSNDTVLKRDTTILKVPVTVPPIIINNPIYRTKNFRLDTVLNGLHIIVDTNQISVSGKVICENTNITNTGFVTDNRRLGLARDSLANYIDSFALYYANFESAKDSIVSLNTFINIQQQNFDKDKSSVSKTFGWFLSAFWHTYKWWLLAFIIGFSLAKFKFKLF